MEPETKEFLTRTEFRDEIRELLQGLERRLDNMSRQIQSVEGATKPNFASWASWASVVITIVGLLCGGMFYHFNSKIESGDQNRKDTFHQINTRIERVENNADENLMDEVRRYRDLVHDKLQKGGD